MSDSQVELKLEQSARRRLVRGVFGSPVLLTLYSGTAHANASHLACVVNRNATPQTLGVATTPDSLYLRYQLYAFVNKRSLEVRLVDGHWLRGSELDVFNRAGNTHWLGANWQRFNIATNALVGSPQSAVPTCTAGNPLNFELRKVSQWVALRVDSRGKLVGAGSSGGGSSVAASCWNSFAVGSTG